MIETYETYDIEERDVTMALRDMFVAISKNGVTENPLSIVCKSLVRHIEPIKFAFYCYENDETGIIAARKKDAEIIMPPPDIQRRVVARLRRITANGEVGILHPEQSLAMLPPALRKKFKCHRAVAVRVLDNNRYAAILVAFVAQNFEITDRHRAWFSIFGEASSALITQQRAHDRALHGKDKNVLDDADLMQWVRKGMKDSRIKAIVGSRGIGKTSILYAIREMVLKNGANESNVVSIDFETSRSRRFKTAEDILKYLEEFPESDEPYYLFLDEVGMISWHSDLLKSLSKLEGWNVWVAASSANAVKLTRGNNKVMSYRIWANPSIPRTRKDLERAWCQTFMRDVVVGVDHHDIRAKEMLAEYYSDHLGEVKSLRTISHDLKALGRSVSPMSIATYRQSLIDAYLIEVSEIYDIFEKEVIASIGGRVFYTDIELRSWRYGKAPTYDAVRLELNRLYLKLRKKYDKVYTPRDCDADFVTIEANGRTRLWKVPADSIADAKHFRWGGGKSQ